jgi:hypothetical protein
MRAFIVLLFVAGGTILSAKECSAQFAEPIPTPPASDGVAGMAPLVHRINGSGNLPSGNAATPCPVVSYCYGGANGGTCGCGDDGNCACHGSYKYPVPSQYTWYWPGIYSQHAMTQYISPWRYPDLNPIPEYWKLDPTEDRSGYSGHRY